MPDWGGGLFTAFMAAKDVGKEEKGQKGGPEPEGDDSQMVGQYDPAADPGWVYNHNTDTYEMMDGRMIPGNGSYDPNGPPGGTDGGQGGQQPQQGGAWGRGRGFGK